MTLIQKYNPLLKRNFQQINDITQIINNSHEQNTDYQIVGGITDGFVINHIPTITRSSNSTTHAFCIKTANNEYITEISFYVINYLDVDYILDVFSDLINYQIIGKIEDELLDNTIENFVERRTFKISENIAGNVCTIKFNQPVFLEKDKSYSFFVYAVNNNFLNKDYFRIGGGDTLYISELCPTITLMGFDVIANPDYIGSSYFIAKRTEKKQLFKTLLDKNEVYGDTYFYDDIYVEGNLIDKSKEFIIKKFEIDNIDKINKFWDFGEGTGEDGLQSTNYSNCIFKIENENNELLYNDLLVLANGQNPYLALKTKCADFFSNGSTKLFITVYFNIKYKKINRIEALNKSFYNLLNRDYYNYRRKNYFVDSSKTDFVADFQNWSECGFFTYIDTAICWFTNRNDKNISFKQGEVFKFSLKKDVKLWDKNINQYVYLTDAVGNYFNATCINTRIYRVNEESIEVLSSNLRWSRGLNNDWFKKSFVRVYEYNIVSSDYYFFVVKPLGEDLFFIKNLPEPDIAEELGLKIYGYFFQDDDSSTPFIREISAYYSNNHYEFEKSDILKTNHLVSTKFNPKYVKNYGNFNKKMKFFVLDKQGNGSELSDLYIDVETLKTGYTVGLKLKTE